MLGSIQRDYRRDSFLDDLDDIKTRLDDLERFGITQSDFIGGIDTKNPVYNVVEYGALGANDSGDATTNQQAIQRAFNVAPDDAHVVIPEGRYYTDATILISGKDHVWVTGPGVIRPNGAFPAFTIDDTSSRSTEFIVIRDLRIIGNGSTSTGILVENTNGNGVREIRIINTEISQCLKAIHVNDDSGTHRIWIEGNRLTADDISGSIGIHLESADNKIFNNTIRGFDEGIQVDGASTMIGGNHIFMSPSSSHDTVISVRRGMSSSAYGLTIVNNYIDGQPDDGAIILDSQGIRGVTITGNYFRITQNKGPFIVWEHSAGGAYDIQDVTVIGNFFYGVEPDPSVAGDKTNSITMSNSQTDGSDQFHFHSNVWTLATPYSTKQDTIQAGTYAGSYTPNPMLGRILTITLTGNISINDPSAADKGGIGNLMTFVFTQDGSGGHTVTFGGAYTTGWSDTGNTANLQSTITFYWDGSGWIQIGGQSPYM